MIDLKDQLDINNFDDHDKMQMLFVSDDDLLLIYLEKQFPVIMILVRIESLR